MRPKSSVSPLCYVYKFTDFPHENQNQYYQNIFSLLLSSTIWLFFEHQVQSEGTIFQEEGLKNLWALYHCYSKFHVSNLLGAHRSITKNNCHFFYTLWLIDPFRVSGSLASEVVQLLSWLYCAPTWWNIYTWSLVDLLFQSQAVCQSWISKKS